MQQALAGLPRSIAQDDEAQRQRWRAELSQAVGGLGGLLTGLAPEFDALLGQQPPVADISPLEARHRFTTVIRGLLKAVCRPEHPVVLFIDDWQWADAASLDLLSKLEVGSTLRYLLLVAAYRENEADEHHPLTATLGELNRLAVPLELSPVRNLPLEEVRALLADTLQPRVRKLDTLAGARLRALPDPHWPARQTKP